jgi:cyclic pyranopterin phosphate synthase
LQKWKVAFLNGTLEVFVRECVYLQDDEPSTATFDLAKGKLKPPQSSGGLYGGKGSAERQAQRYTPGRWQAAKIRQILASAAVHDQGYRFSARKGGSMSEDGVEAGLSHVGSDGQAHMVDVSEKPITARVAEAEGDVRMSSATLDTVHKNAAAKGDVLSVARIAGILAAKKASELIPLCHGLPLDHIEISFELDDESSSIRIRSVARTQARTGVEMEALTAVAVAGLTIYDMLKAADRAMVIGGIRVISKSGGRSGVYHADAGPTRGRTP